MTISFTRGKSVLVGSRVASGRQWTLAFPMNGPGSWNRLRHIATNCASSPGAVVSVADATTISEQNRTRSRLVHSMLYRPCCPCMNRFHQSCWLALLGRGIAMTTRRLLRLPEVIEITGLGRDTIYRYIREGRFPRQRRISQRASGWRDDEIKAWVDSRPTVEPATPTESAIQTWLRSPTLL